jgi:hypothetical protein
MALSPHPEHGMSFAHFAAYLPWLVLQQLRHAQPPPPQTEDAGGGGATRAAVVPLLLREWDAARWLVAAHPSLLERRPLRLTERRRLLHAGPAATAAAAASVGALVPMPTPAPLLLAEPSFEGFTLTDLSSAVRRPAVPRAFAAGSRG